ncbi:hypothetical protein AAGV37_24865 [Pseudomonas protegens]|uniref:hypothetical protein n=1 Tax=Pseudomonas protegens TaxID=380021 RepID=UPI003158954C
MLLPRARRDFYRGNDVKKKRTASQHNQYAAAIDMAVDQLYARQTSRFQVYDLTAIAHEAGLDETIVRSIGFSGGHNGMTLLREDIPE